MRGRSLSEHLNDLFDFLADNEWVTIHQIARRLKVSRSHADRIVRSLRLMLGNDDTIQVVCDPGEYRKPHQYRLVGTLDDAKRWLGQRMTDMESRLETMQAEAATFVRVADGRTLDGRRARIFQRGFTRMLEDLADLKS